MPEKYEWRKKEKNFYFPKAKPEVVKIPEFKFLTISGEGSPEEKQFIDCIGSLYPVAYTIKMTLKKLDIKPKGYSDYTVYPLEGVWDINDDAKKTFTGTINKKDLVYKLMIRQPDFVEEGFYKKMLEMVQKKKPLPLLEEIKFEKNSEGKCVQMLHVGKFADEPASFAIMEEFAEKEGLKRLSKVHREIYLSDFRKVPEEKLKTVLRFKVN